MTGRAAAQAQKVVAPVIAQSSAGYLQRKCACGQHTPGGGECEGCKKEGAMLQRRSAGVFLAGGGVGVAPPIVHDFLRSRVEASDASTRAFGETGVGLDLSRLPVHASGEQSEVYNAPDPHEENKQSPKESGRNAKKAPCEPPTGLRLVSTQEVEFPGYLTGGGICALMRLLPESGEVCHVNVKEELSSASGTTCPKSLLLPSLCHGDSEFPLGKRPTGGPCKALDPKATEFTDRHTVNISGMSVLHDSKRNPKALKSCSIVCDQEYYIPGKNRASLGHFLIQTDLRMGLEDKKKITRATVTKKAKS